MVAPVTQGEEAVQNARGSFDPKTYENTAKAVPNVAPLDGADLPDVPGFVAGPRAAALPMGNFAQAPHPLDVGPIQSALSSAQSAYNAAQTQQEQQGLARQKAIAAQIGSQNYEESLDWQATGKGADGKGYSAADFQRLQNQRYTAAGIDPSLVRASNSDADGIVKGKSTQDARAAIDAQKEVQEGIWNTHNSFTRLAVQGKLEQSARKSDGTLNLSKAMEIVNEELAAVPEAQRASLTATLVPLITAAGKDSQDLVNLQTAVGTYETRKKELIQQGVDPIDAGHTATKEAIRRGDNSSAFRQYLNEEDGIKISEEKRRAQDLVNTQTNEQQLSTVLGGVDWTSQDSIGSYFPDPRNTKPYEDALRKSKNPKALQALTALEQRRHDSEDLAKQAEKIQRNQIKLKALEATPIINAPTKPVESVDSLIKRGAVSPELFVHGVSADGKPAARTWNKAAFSQDGKSLSDYGRVLAASNGQPVTVAGYKAGIDEYGVPTTQPVDYFQKGADGQYTGNFTEDGRKKYAGRNVVSKAVQDAIFGAPVQQTDGSQKSIRELRIKELRLEINAYTQDYNQLNSKYQRADLKQFEGFPSLEERLGHKENYKQNRGFYQSDSPLTQAGSSSVLQSIAHAIAGNESGGNYRAQSRTSSASGKYQYLDGTWAGYGGYARAADAPPAVQEAKFAQDQARFYRKYQDPGLVAVAHFQGEGTADSLWRAVKSGNHGAVDRIMGKRDANGVTTRQYLNKFNRGMQG